jgi:hypothetical protein
MQIRFSDEELARLRVGIRSMTRDSRLYKLLRDELSLRGNWKQMRRGKPGITPARSIDLRGFAPRLDRSSEHVGWYDG